jgi:hypothetical protein
MGSSPIARSKNTQGPFKGYLGIFLDWLWDENTFRELKIENRPQP